MLHRTNPNDISLNGPKETLRASQSVFVKLKITQNPEREITFNRRRQGCHQKVDNLLAGIVVRIRVSFVI